MAFWNIQETVSEAFRGWLSDIATDFINSGMKYITDYIVSPIKLEEIPLFNDFLTGAKAIGASLVILFLYLRLLGAMRDMATNEDDPNFAEIIGSAAISMGFVFSFDYVIRHYMIPMVNEVVTWVGGLNTPVDLAGKVINQISPGSAMVTAPIHLLILAVFIGLGALLLTIASYLMVAQLFIGVIAGPVIMSSYTNRTAVFKTYLTALGTVMFTKIIHVITFKMVIACISAGTFEMLILSLAFLVVGAMGPVVLQIFLMSSGVASGSTAAGRFAAYKVMFSGFKR